MVREKVLHKMEKVLHKMYVKSNFFVSSERLGIQASPCVEFIHLEGGIIQVNFSSLIQVLEQFSFILL